MNSKPMAEKSHGSGTLGILLLVIILVLGIGIGTVISTRVGAERKQLLTAGQAQPILVSNSVPLQGFSEVATAIEPAVVNISSQALVPTRTARRGSPQTPRRQRPSESPFDFWFGDPDLLERFFGNPPGQPQRVRSLGSGIIADDKGYIITNYHVVSQGGGRRVADKISVKLADGTEYHNAKVVGYDEPSDIAVIRINPRGPLPVAKFGDSVRSRVGDWVLAVGSPFGLDQTVTAGIISATGRSGLNQYVYNRYIQTDASINRGNSGGPLVNMAGEVIGINSFIQSTTGGSVGVGFAVPSSIFLNVYNQIIQTGKVSRGFLGISMSRSPMTPVLARHFGLKDRKGVLVTDLIDAKGEPSMDGPAAKAGLRPDDVIVEIDGRKLEESSDLSTLVAETPPGKTLKIKAIRKGQEKTYNVTVAERVLDAPSRGSITLDDEKEEIPPAERQEIGMQIDNITPQTMRELKLKSTEGVVVTEVKSGSLADDAGLEEKDVIIEFNGQKVEDTTQFASLAKKLKSGGDIVLKVLRVNDAGRPDKHYFGFNKP